MESEKKIMAKFHQKTSRVGTGKGEKVCPS